MKYILSFITLIICSSAYAQTYHPADTNKDWQISYEEFQAYDTAWKYNKDWPEAPNPIPGLYAARAGFLYKTGNCYNVGNADAPLKWDSDRDCDRSVDSIDECPDNPNKMLSGICGCNLEEGICRPYTNSIGMNFVYIKAGKFMMGSPSDELGHQPDEIYHQVTLTNGYYMQTTEVTQGQWKAVMGSNTACNTRCGDNCPVECVSWNDTQNFIDILNDRETGRKYRLPNEAEWEYAARAGSISPFTYGDCLSTDDANYNGNNPWTGCEKGTNREAIIEVGLLRANAWGLYDMHGNVWEWCIDSYAEYPNNSVIDPQNISSESNKVLRGGSWYSNYPNYCRSANRYYINANDHDDYSGFRLVFSADFELDSDKDNILDCFDGCPNDSNKIEPGICGCGNLETDSDKDNTPDCIDGCPNDPNKIEPGKCGCGIIDAERCRFTNTIGMSFVYIEPGTFIMGSPSDEPQRDSGEIQHQVTLTKGYFMQTTEVTQGQWKAIMGNNPSYNSSCGDDCPVERVSWYNAQDFIAKLNNRDTDKSYRLPTEAEWEYAARAGSTKAFAFGDCLSTNDANYDGNYPLTGCSKGTYRNTIIEVGQLRANTWGLYDMHGNVWEWCSDCYSDYPTSSVTDPVGPSSGSRRVFRGGSWDCHARSCRSAARRGSGPGGTDSYVGFRLACPQDSGKR